MKPVVQAAVVKMTPAERFEFEERAAIMEYEGNFSRQMAEFLALGVYNSKKKEQESHVS